MKLALWVSIDAVHFTVDISGLRLITTFDERRWDYPVLSLMVGLSGAIRAIRTG